jgi:hypothetical protein
MSTNPEDYPYLWPGGPSAESSPYTPYPQEGYYLTGPEPVIQIGVQDHSGWPDPPYVTPTFSDDGVDMDEIFQAIVNINGPDTHVTPVESPVVPYVLA